MATPFDFPNSPTNGQTYTPIGGLTYTWNGYGWQLSTTMGGGSGGGGVPEAPQDGSLYARQNALWAAFTIPAASSANPLMNGTAAPGSGTTWSRADHVHPSDTTKLGDAPSDGLVYGRKNAAWSTIVGGAVVSDTAPTGTLQAGQMWWESDTGSLYIYYNDGDSNQWVMVVPGQPGMPQATGDFDMAGYTVKNTIGVGFPATQVLSADPNTLDDYEEGPWTPVLRFGGNSVGLTYTKQQGRYTKIGNRVTATCWIIVNAKGTSTGPVTIAGLPFPSGLGVDYWSSTVGWYSSTSATAIPGALVPAGVSYINVYASGAAMTEAGFATGTNIGITAMYEVA